MRFRLEDARPILERTPAVLRALLDGLPDAWLAATEGPGSWSPCDVVGHLVHGERTDWIPRTEHMLAFGSSRPFQPFDREGMFSESRGKSLKDLLDTFAELRAASLARLAALQVTDGRLGTPGLHPDLGPVTLSQHLATWVAHDLSHIGQIVRVMGKQYAGEVGPWGQYLPMLGGTPASEQASP